MTRHRECHPIGIYGSGIALLAVGIFGVAAASFNPDQMVANSFTAALAEPSPAATNPVSRQTAATKTAVSGTEDFWLGTTEQTEKSNIAPVTWQPSSPFETLSPGDEITFGTGQHAELLKVISIVRTNLDAYRGQVKLDIVARAKDDPQSPVISFSTTVRNATAGPARHREL